MFGIGTGELIVILLIAAVVIGPEQMVELAGKMGRWIAQFRRMTDSATAEFREAFSMEEVNQIKDEIAQLRGELTALTSGEPLPERPVKALPSGSQPVIEGKAEAVATATTVEAIASDSTPVVAAEGSVPQAEAGLSYDAFAPRDEPAPKVEDSPDVEPVEVSVAELVPEDQDVEPTLLEEPLLVAEEATPEAVQESEAS